MALDVSALTYLMPVFGFILVFVIVFAILKKTEILGDNAFIDSLVSFIMAIIFVSVSPVRQYIEAVIPWIGVLVVSLFFVLIIIGFSQKKMEDMLKPSLAWVFIILLILIFLIAALNVFAPVFEPYLPGTSGTGGDTFLLQVKDFLFSERFLGALLLLVVAAIVSWWITKK